MTSPKPPQPLAGSLATAQRALLSAMPPDDVAKIVQRVADPQTPLDVAAFNSSI